MGAAGTIAKVNHGYARNYLIPNKLAAVRRGKQAGSVAAVQVESSIASAATGGAPSSALTEEEREKLVVAQQRRRLESAVKKLTTQTLVRI
jgi:ribosomal protein L9